MTQPKSYSSSSDIEFEDQWYDKVNNIQTFKILSNNEVFNYR
jgi:hypothetical protein